MDDNLIWNVIEKYFESDTNLLVKHHINSFDDFFNNKIYNIIKEKNPIKIFKDKNEVTKNYNLQAEIFFGGKEGNNLYFGKPIIFDKDREHYMFPNEARLRNMTYAITLHMDIDIIYKIYDKDNNETITESTLKNIYFGKFPIMLNSNLCILNTLNRQTKFNMGECKNDLGGYFIIDGKEKVIIPQEKFADNMLYIKDNFNELYSHSAEIRCVSEDASKPVRTLSIRILRPSPTLENNQLLVNVPNVRKPVPFFILMRALGVTSDKEIIKYCLLNIENNKNYLNFFRSSIYDAGNIYEQETALKYIATLTKGKTISHVLEILMDYLLPQIGDNNFKNKALFLGFMVNKLLKVFNNEESPTDRDSFKFKRVELTGSLIYDLFKEYYTLQQKHIFKAIDKEYYYKQGIYQNNFISLIENNYNEYFKERILENGFKKAFKGNWGAEEHTKRPEVIQDLNRLSYNSFLSHLRKLNLPLDSSAKVVGPRLLHSSQWGIIDPVDTPDGGNVGLHKHLSLGAFITNGYSGNKIINFLREILFIELLSECNIDYISNATKIFVNGVWIGIINNPQESKEVLLNYRRLGLIPIFTSISWSIKENIIYIFTDSGRLCRPIFYVINKIPSFIGKEEYIINNDYNFYNLLIGVNEFNKISNNIDNLNNLINLNLFYSNPNDLYKSKNINKLLENCGIIDYIDTSESENCLIKNDIDEITNLTTHLEIHPSLLLGVMGNQIVFPENNQLPRNLFSCGQSKQAVSLYNSNFNNRIDKMGVVLNNGQKPLVISRYLKLINNEEHPYGLNAIVAIGCYGGYNVEDSILFNEGSIKRGMFNTTYFNMYEAREESSKILGNVVDSKFANIEKEIVVGKKPGYDYSLLDNYGIIKENTELDDKKVIIGKITTNTNNPNTFLDASITPKKGQLGFVDKSFITDSEEGFRIAKVRIREERIPAQGDKFCSRCGQKGTVGLIIPEKNMPFTENGIRPDLIINPHALPSRMTIGQLIETLMGKACSIYGGHGDCTAFVNKGSKHKIFGNMLNKVGYSSTGNEILYNGETGEQMNMEVFIGPCYYMRLKHMVKDKINYRAQGPRTSLTRQTVQGRANDGGLRIGEMERDGILAHGASAFLQESMLKRGDEYYLAICNNTGTIAIYNYEKKIFISPFMDGPLKFSNNIITNNENIKVITKYGRNFSIVKVPYCFKLLMQELQTMNIQMRIITEENVDQLTSMNSESTKNILNDLYLKDKISLDEESIDKAEINNEINKLANIKPKNKKLLDSDDDSDSGLDPVTIESVKKAEEYYNQSKELDDDEVSLSDDEENTKPPISIGERIQDSLNSVINLVTGQQPEDAKKVGGISINLNNKENNENNIEEQTKRVNQINDNNIISGGSNETNEINEINEVNENNTSDKQDNSNETNETNETNEIKKVEFDLTTKI
jgi:DNA-directed RNA polymerase II subunit RPB2